MDIIFIYDPKGLWRLTHYIFKPTVAEYWCCLAHQATSDQAVSQTCPWWTGCFPNLQSHRPQRVLDSWVGDTCNSLRIFTLWFQTSLFRNSLPEKFVLSGNFASFFFFPFFFRIWRQFFSVAFFQHKGNGNLGDLCWQTWHPPHVYMGCKKSFQIEASVLIR